MSAISRDRGAGQAMLEAALHYADDRQWDVVPGTSVTTQGWAVHCSCEDLTCERPGAHPAVADWSIQATASRARIRRWWNQQPEASILLPTGRGFDAIDVSERAGCLALARLERLGVPPGPVATDGTGRMYFFVMPGAGEKLPDLVARGGWQAETLDLRCHGDRDYVVAPPSWLGRGRVARWIRQPTEANRWLPETHEVVAPIAYATGISRS